ncbi:hypothetical protein [Mesorhizobium sp. Cs1299R1N3]|uniref:hypothetical protein n=1 Tax=Mesorhizobium sp. Cs1299R1N3 TaxID=3015173 RepID=UPI00301D53F3
MDRDTRRNRPEGSARDGGDAAGLSHLPRELLSELARRVVTDDPVQTAKSFTNFKQTSRSVRDEFDGGGAVGEFHTRLGRLGTSAQALYTAAMPPENGMSNLLRARYLSRAVAPILKFQNAPRKSAVADSILSLTQPGAQAFALSKMGDKLGDFSPADRTRLLDRSIELLTATAAQGAQGQWSVLVSTVRAIKKGHDHLNEEQRERLNGAFSQDPYLGALYRSIQVSTAGRAIPQRNPDLDGNINAIENQAAELPAEWSIGQANTIAQIGASINDTYDNARAELMHSDRSRDLTR